MGTTDRLCSYRAALSFKNHTIRIFDNEKFFNSNELTTVEAIDDISIYMESPEIKDKLLVLDQQGFAKAKA